jgi:hypothetical protein
MNGVYETTTTSGTGTVTLSAVTGRPRFSDAGVGALVPYAIKDGSNWEWGIGTVGGSNSLLRSVVTATYVAGTYDNTSPAAISLSGSSADVYLASIAEALATGLPIVSGVYGRKAVMSTHWSTYANSTLTVAADRLYLLPFRVDSAYDINGFYIDMNTAGAASTKARIGLYRMKSDGQPGALIVETADIDTSVAAAVLSPSVTRTRIAPGWYYIALVCSGTPTFQAYPSSAIGISPLGLENGASSMLPIQAIYKSIAGWSALPADPTGFIALSPGSASIPAIALKLA